MGDVVCMSGVERRDIVGPILPAAHVLQAAIALGIDEVVIVGRCRDGTRYVATSINDMDKVVGVLMDGVSNLSGAVFADPSPGLPEPA